VQYLAAHGNGFGGTLEKISERSRRSITGIKTMLLGTFAHSQQNQLMRWLQRWNAR
jgi:hypothetical protein